MIDAAAKEELPPKLVWVESRVGGEVRIGRPGGMGRVVVRTRSGDANFRNRRGGAERDRRTARGQRGAWVLYLSNQKAPQIVVLR